MSLVKVWRSISVVSNAPPKRRRRASRVRRQRPAAALLDTGVFACTLLQMLAYHAIFSTYGFWLPNDPRGSGSKFVGSAAIFHAGGKATKVSTRRSVASRPHDRSLRIAAKQALARPPVAFSGTQARAVGRGFASAIAQSTHCLIACAILPDHVHIVVEKGKHPPRRVVGHLKRAAALQLKSESNHPFQQEHQRTGKLPTCWGEGCRIVYLDSVEDVLRTIRYVEENPAK